MALNEITQRILYKLRSDGAAQTASDFKRVEAGAAGVEKELKAVAAESAKTDAALGKMADSSAGKLSGLRGGFSSIVDSIGKTTVVLGSLGAAGAIAFESLKSSGERARLEMAAGAANIGRLQDAFDGLIPRMDVLSFAAKTQHGVLKLTQEQMETLARAAVALSRNGMGELDEVLQKLTASAVKAKVDGLDELGLAIEQGHTATETLSNLFDGLNKKIVESGDVAATTADKVQQLASRWADAKAAVEDYIAATLDIDSAREGKGFLFDAANVLSFGQAGRNLENRKTQEANASTAALDIGANIKSGEDAFGSTIQPTTTPNIDINIGEATIVPTPGGGGGRIGPRRYGSVSAALSGLDAASTGTDSVGSPLGWSNPNLGTAAGYSGRVQVGGLDESLGVVAGNNDQSFLDPMHSAFEKEVGSRADRYKAFADQQKKKNTSQLEDIFGPADDFSVYQSAFEGLGEAVGGAYEAIVTGSGGAVAAFKKVAAGQMMATGKRAAVEALHEIAMAAGSLASGNLPEAGAHALAAAKYGAVAVAAGIAANAMGAGSSGGGGGGGSSTSSNSIASQVDHGKPADTRPIYIINGSAFDDSTPRMRAVMARDQVNKAIAERNEQ